MFLWFSKRFGGQTAHRRVCLHLGLLMAPTLMLGGCASQNATEGGDQVATGWEWFRGGEYDLAEKAFSRAAQSSANDVPARAEALYGLAVTWHLRRPGGDSARATNLYRKVMALAPEHDLAAWSALGLARLPEVLPPGKEPPRAERLQAYEEVIDRFPEHPAGIEAFLLQQSLRLAMPSSDDEPREVLAKLDDFLAKHPGSPYAGAAWGLVEQATAWLGLPDRRLEAVFRQWQSAEKDSANPDSKPDLSATYWRIATIAEFEVGDFDLAREYYGKLIDEYPTQQRVFLAKQELQRMAKLEEKLRREMSP